MPAVLGIYFITPAKYKNLVLLLASLFFYFYGEPIYSLLMVFSIASAYLHGLWMDKAPTQRHKKIAFISSVSFSVGALLFFKYHLFFVNNFNSLFGTSIVPLKLLLPIGISFYTFQILSYLIDLYFGRIKVQKNPINLATYVAMFPQLIAGPIVRYSTIEAGLAHRTHSIPDIAYGINRFVIGLAKKVILANTLGEIGVLFNGADEKSVLFFWMAAIAFTLQIYFDFSGYSDMAIGLGRVFGFKFLENFNYPYISKSVTEFWRRWHISLGSWFRDYIYIPMGGNRVSLLKWGRNIFVVWFLTGFWHGAEWNFVVWGLYFAVFLVLEKFFLNKLLGKLPGAIAHFYLLPVVIIGFVIFNADGMGEALINLKGMFGLLNVPFANTETIYYLKSYGFVFILAAIAATPLFKKIAEKLKSYTFGEKTLSFSKPVIMVVLLLMCTGFLIDGSFNPFIYFRF
ncbi:MAG: MBOAT family O-acyltransferase [Dehalococcoidales bacterium]